MAKVPGNTIIAGSRVFVSNNKEFVKRLQKGHGGWIDDMSVALGKSAEVLMVDSNGDVCLKVGGNTWRFNPFCVTRIRNATLRLVKEDQQDDSPELLMLQHLLEQLQTDNNEDLVAEAAKGDLEAVRKILEENPEKVNDKSFSNTVLQVAVVQGQKLIVEALLEADANMELRDDEGYTALHYATLCNDAEIMELLLSNGANINAFNKTGLTSLHLAVVLEHESCVEILIKYKCDVNMQDCDRLTALHEAIRVDNLDIVDLLLEVEKLNFALRNKRGFNVLHYTALQGSNLIMDHLLAKTMHLVNTKNEDGFTALHLAALNGHRLVVESLLVTGRCAINAKTESDETPLFFAVYKANCDVIEMLVDKGADVNARDEEGDTALHVALNQCFLNQTTTIETMDVDAPTVLEILLNLKTLELEDIYLAIACFLAQKGADLTFTNEIGTAPKDLIADRVVEDVITFYASLKSVNDVRPNSGLCSICYEVPPTVSFEPCGHRVSCEECCIRMKKCIFCQTRIVQKIGPDGQLLSNPSLQARTDKLHEAANIEKSERCPICLDASNNVAFLCGHRACSDCAQNIQICHMCRREITQKIKLY